MRSFIPWLKGVSVKTEEKRYIILIRALLISALPLLCCLVYCGMQGRSIADVYLPSSEWNDELFYFKQVEGIVNFGYPRGYFGFNESHALKLSFAAWSPALVLPWILWGIFFGWNFMSPVICNIILLTAAVFLFMVSVKPSWKQTGILALLFCLYTLFVRYMLSGMPEVICFAFLIVFYGLAVNYLDNEKKWKLILLFVISGLLTLMRPYMLLFMLLPIYLTIRKYRIKGVICSGITMIIVLLVYAMIKHYFGAEYFAPLFFTDWITTFFDKGIAAGIHNFFGTLFWMGKGFTADMVQGFRTGLAAGAFFGGYTVMMLVLLWQSFVDWRKSRDDAENKLLKNQLIIESHLSLCFVGMLFALLLMYKLTEGSKHLLTFMAVGVFVIALMDTKAYKKAVLIGALFAYLYSYKAVDPYDYQVPFAEDTLVQQVEQWKDIFEREIVFNNENVPNFDNVIIWTFNDEVGSEVINTKWQLLYSLPEGMGISCCTKEYVVDNFAKLNSKYIALPSGGIIDEMCAEAGYEEIGRDADMVVYLIPHVL